jgi:hypothetical protein
LEVKKERRPFFSFCATRLKENMIQESTVGQQVIEATIFAVSTEGKEVQQVPSCSFFVEINKCHKFVPKC